MAVFIRFRFSKLKELKYLSHLDIINILSRALARSKIKVKYTQGFNPKLIMALSNPIPLGVESYGEYCDIELEDDIEVNEFIKKFNSNLPIKLIVNSAVKLYKKPPSLMSQIDLLLYDFKIGIIFNQKLQPVFKEKIDNKEFSFKDSFNIEKLNQFYKVEDAIEFVCNLLKFNILNSEIGISKSVYKIDCSYGLFSGLLGFKLKVYGYAKTIQNLNNSIFKYNDFLDNLKSFIFLLNNKEYEELFKLNKDFAKIYEDEILFISDFDMNFFIHSTFKKDVFIIHRNKLINPLKILSLF